MRYKLDSNGYFSAVFFGCNGLDCQEYNGTIPSGFLDNIKAYKLIDGVIVYDEERAKECADQCATECDNFHHTTKKEVLDLIGGREKTYKKAFTTSDWESMTSSATYKLEIPKDEHGMITPYISDYYIEEDGAYKKAICSTTIIYPKTVRVKTLTPTNGFLIIKDKEN